VSHLPDRPPSPLPLRLNWQIRGTSNNGDRIHENDPHRGTLLAQVLAARGYDGGPDLDTFLHCDNEPEPDYETLPDIRGAAERIAIALKRHERIVICGDYDIDGVTATALLLATLRLREADVHAFLPQRQHEGYGLTQEALERFAAQGTRLLITVDNGTTSFEEMTIAQHLGLDVIITDHHLPGPELPPAVAIVNPQLNPDAGVLAPLCGVGVAYALARVLDRIAPAPKGDAREYLDLVALGTLSDQAPLVLENRRLTRLGVAQCRHATRKGLWAMARTARCNMRQLNLAEALSQKLIPRLNAAGRLADPHLALELLLTDDEDTARAIASQLEELNRTRRLLSLAVEAQALARVVKPDESKKQAVVLWDSHWHQGVLGIVASRIAAHTRRPALLLAPEKPGYWRGSGRSVPHFDIHQALQPLEALLVRFGGHEQAVGLTVRDEDIETFAEAFKKSVSTRLGDTTAKQKTWLIDAEVDLNVLSYENVNTLEALEPTGPANPAAIFGARRVSYGRQELRGPQNEHLWIELLTETLHVEAIAFGMGHIYPLTAQAVDIVFAPLLERFQGRPRLTLKILELRPSE
jgi:single-stranded-DNA-specific exonuclease